MNEGLTKYGLHYEPEGPPCPTLVALLNPLRDRLYERKLLGVDAQGVGQGNISGRADSGSCGPAWQPERLRPERPAGLYFLITGTGSSQKGRLDESDYTLVTGCDFGSFSLSARGPVAPSSEAFTHCAVYRLDERIRFVIHVHHMGLWHAFLKEAMDGRILSTGEAEYGTREMARRVFEMYGPGGKWSEPAEEEIPGGNDSPANAMDISGKNCFVMPNHEGGIVSFGRTPEEAEEPLYRGLALL